MEKSMKMEILLVRKMYQLDFFRDFEVGLRRIFDQPTFSVLRFEKATKIL